MQLTIEQSTFLLFSDLTRSPALMPSDGLLIDRGFCRVKIPHRHSDTDECLHPGIASTNTLLRTSGPSSTLPTTTSVFCTWNDFIRSTHPKGDRSFDSFDVASLISCQSFLICRLSSLDAHMISNDTIVRPSEATEEDLLLVHTSRYLDTLKWSVQVARVLEVPPVAFLPNFLVQWRVLRPLRYQTGGTILVNPR